MHIQEIFYDIIKYDFRAKPGKLRERLEEEMTRVYGELEGEIHTEGITPNQLSGFLKRARKRATADYFEESIGGLHEFIQEHHRNEEDQELHRFYSLNSPEDATDVQGGRINLVISTDALLKSFSCMKDTGLHGFQLCTDSKYKLFLNNYPIIVLGCFDACQQFNLIALSVSNKEDEKAFSDIFIWTQRACMEVEADLTPNCTMSDNCEAIMNSFQNLFPQATIGNCFFHLQKNIKSKQGSWAIPNPDASLYIGEKGKNCAEKRKDQTEWILGGFRWLADLKTTAEYDTYGALIMAAIARDNEGLASSLCNE